MTSKILSRLTKDDRFDHMIWVGHDYSIRDVKNDLNDLDTDKLKSVVKEFLSYLDHTETSDSGIEFNPIGITCCRALMMDKVSECISNLRELSK